jgi:hypothetical protein
VPIWFDLDGERSCSVPRPRHPRGAPSAATVAWLCASTTRGPPFAFVTIDGTRRRRAARRAAALGHAHRRPLHGEERAEEYGRPNAVEGELLVCVRAVRVVARTGIAD